MSKCMHLILYVGAEQHTLKLKPIIKDDEIIKVTELTTENKPLKSEAKYVYMNFSNKPSNNKETVEINNV